MKRERYDAGKMPQIIITECNSELVIRGWDDAEVLAKGDDYEVTETKEGMSITSNSRLRLMVPTHTNLTLTHINGDLVIKGVDGDVDLGEVTGDVILMGLGNVKIDTIHNDLSAKRINGSIGLNTIHGDIVARDVHDLMANKVYGDLSGRIVNGLVQLDEVMGDISLRSVSGNITVDKGHRDANLRNLGGITNTVSDVAGDIRLYGSLEEGKHTFTASGDIILRWPEDTPLTVSAVGSKIINRIEFDQIVEEKGSLNANINDSQTLLTLNAKGSVILKTTHVVDEKWDWEQSEDTDFDFTGVSVDLAGLGERISSQLNEQITRVTTELENKLGPEYSQKMAEKIAKKAEWAAAKAERAAERAMRQAERSMRRSSWGVGVSKRSSSPPVKKKNTSEEQLKILKMVEQGIITTEEASILLEALEN